MDLSETFSKIKHKTCEEGKRNERSVIREGSSHTCHEARDTEARQID